MGTLLVRPRWWVNEMRPELSKNGDSRRTTSVRGNAVISTFEGFLQRDHLITENRASASIGETHTTTPDAFVCIVSRLIDIATSAIAIIVYLPLIVLLAALVALDSGITPVQWQMRINAHGRAFKRYRFRTLGPTHDDRARRLTDAQRTSWFGSFMRASGLDQLPQLVNVLMGDISLVRIENSRRKLARRSKTVLIDERRD